MGRRLVVGGLLLLFAAVVVWRRRQGRPLIDPPYCAWRFVSNFKSYNVAFPDAKSIYQVSLMHLGPGDEIRISSDSIPYGRYFSFQTYSIPDFVSSASVRDVDMVPENGPNCYANLTAAVRGEKQGGYTFYITAHGDKGHANELRALPDGQDSGYFVLFFRIYQDHADAPPHPDVDPSACFGPMGRHPRETPQEWGWACPPEVSINRGGAGFRALPFCRYRRKYGIRYHDVTKPVQECPHEPNSHFSFFLPSPYYLQGKFGNHDAKYLFSCAIQPSKAPPTDKPPTQKEEEEKAADAERGEATAGSRDEQGPEPELWARVSGVLPRTPHSLYGAPYIANVSDYEVRYTSLSSVGRSLPYRGYHTLHDRDIASHYQRTVGPGWNRSFVVWLGPPGVERFPPEVERDGGLFMPWGSSFWGSQIPYPGILYRQILSRGQVLGTCGGGDGEWGAADERPGPHHSGLAEIIPHTCSGDADQDQGAGEGECREGGEVQSWLERELCCGRAAPEWCYLPRYVSARLQHYYPLVTYFSRRDQRLERLGGDTPGALRPLVPPSSAPTSQGGGGGRSAMGSLASKLRDLCNAAVWF